MTENECKKILIDTVKVDDNPNKEEIVSLLKIAYMKFNKTNTFTRNLWNHYEEYWYIYITPSKLVELKKYYDYLSDLLYQIYPPNDDYELINVDIFPGELPQNDEKDQDVYFKEIRDKIIEEIHAAKYIIWIAMAWFTDKVLYDELLKKKEEGVTIEIILDDNEKNRGTEFSLENNFPVHWITIQSYFKNIMHEKFCIIDLKTVIHGTFNWTKAANYNKEHISVDNNRIIAEKFADEFMNLEREN